MSTNFAISDTEVRELSARHDLSAVIADIDVTCFRLDFYEMGQWWDYRRGRRKLTHPAIAVWMETYGFTTFADLPTAAVVAFCKSLKKYLAEAEEGTIPLAIAGAEGDIAHG